MRNSTVVLILYAVVFVSSTLYSFSIIERPHSEEFPSLILMACTYFIVKAIEEKG